ncbi:MAG: PIN domain nuclease, partial [Angustibacter sp.]
ERGLIGVGTPTLLELGYSARNTADWKLSLSGHPVKLMPLISLTPGIESRAVEVQGLLVRVGHHRAPSVPDLLLAATAELSGLTMLHYDKDFELIARLTGQPVEKLALN